LTQFIPLAKLTSMIRGAFWIQRAGVALLLLGSLTVGSIALPHADGVDDTPCDHVMIAHDESAHYIGAHHAPASGETTHCVLCHSLRTFYPAFDRFQQHHYTPLIERLHLGAIERVSAVAWTLVPGRAPPLSDPFA
jgi:hypothetical protein